MDLVESLEVQLACKGSVIWLFLQVVRVHIRKLGLETLLPVLGFGLVAQDLRAFSQWEQMLWSSERKPPLVP
jgi:hypothetical protein